MIYRRLRRSCQLGTTGVIFGVAFVVRAVHFLVDKLDLLFTNPQKSVPADFHFFLQIFQKKNFLVDKLHLLFTNSQKSVPWYIHYAKPLCEADFQKNSIFFL